MISRSYASEGIVLKRVNYAEADRIVTIFTRDFGKVVALAKGVRKLTSSRAGTIESGCEAKFFFVKGKNWDILTQTKLISSHTSAHAGLVRLTQTFQILEIVDNLTVEQQQNPETYQILVDTLKHLDNDGDLKTYLLEQIRLILKSLGFTADKVFTPTSLKEYIEELSQKHLRAKPFLTPKM